MTPNTSYKLDMSAIVYYVPAHSALMLAADISVGSRVPAGWLRPRGLPCKSWLDQIKADITQPIESVLARALDRDIGGETLGPACFAIDDDDIVYRTKYPE